MTENSKKWFWRIIVGVLFIVSLVYVLFWANGFQYDFLGNQFRKTGIVAVEYNNPDSSIILDGEKLDETLPFIIGNLLPGKHSLAVTREGFWEYQLEVNVVADLITRIGSVFLIPLDLLGGSEQIFNDSGDAFNEVWLKDGYMFIHNPQMTVDNFSYAKLRDDNISFLHTNSNLDSIVDVVVFGKDVLLVGVSGERELLDLNEAVVTPVPLSENYIFAGDKWLFYQDDYISAFNRKFTKLLWVKIVKQGVRISNVNYFSSEGREFIAVEFLSEDIGEFYVYSGGQLFFIDRGEIQSVAIDDHNDVYYLKNEFELWKYNLIDKQQGLVMRFTDAFKIIATDYRAFRSMGVLIFSRKNQFWITDTNLENIRVLLEDRNVTDMCLVDGKKLYFWIDKKDDAETYSEQGLYVYDFEQ